MHTLGGCILSTYSLDLVRFCILDLSFNQKHIGFTRYVLMIWSCIVHIVIDSSHDLSTMTQEDKRRNHTELLDHQSTKCRYWWPFRLLICDCRTGSGNKGLVLVVLSMAGILPSRVERVYQACLQ